MKSTFLIIFNKNGFCAHGNRSAASEPGRRCCSCRCANDVLKWSLKGGWSSIFASGSIVVKNLEELTVNGGSGGLSISEPKTIVFLVSSHLARHAQSIRNHLFARSYSECRIVTATAESLHVAELSLEADLMSEFDAYLGFEVEGYFGKVESKVKDWMVESARKNEADPDDDDDIEVDVEYLPLSFATITPELFTIPLVDTLFPNLNSGHAPTSTKSLELPSSFDKPTRQLALALCSLLESLGVKEEIFAAGELSRQVARCIISQSMESPRRTAPQSTTGLIIIDRTLDLTASMSHPDNLLDTIFQTLEQPLIDSLDRQVSPAPLNSHALFPYTFSHGADSDTMDFLRVLTMLSQKDSLVTTRKRLVDLIAKIDPSQRPRVLGRLTLDQMDKLLSVFKDSEESLKKEGVLLVAIAAAVEAAKRSEMSNAESLINIEKLISLSLSESYDPACAIFPVIDVLRKVANSKNGTSSPPTSPQSGQSLNSRPGFSINDALKLATFSYSLLGPDVLTMDPSLKTKLAQAFLGALADTTIGNTETEKMWVSEVMDRLELISAARSTLKQKRLVDSDSPTPYKSFLRRALVSSLTSSDASPVAVKPLAEADDLAHIPYGGTLGNVLNKFSRLLGGAHPKPRDYNTLIVFVIGGVDSFGGARYSRSRTRQWRGECNCRQYGNQ
ncbi:hypothetical protein BDR26DRAFT_49767 [Obelidium mucronatum]|nr:hypothetical protein BDR26DRAFT_49767 [Obelidium mucronatum]